MLFRECDFVNTSILFLSFFLSLSLSFFFRNTVANTDIFTDVFSLINPSILRTCQMVFLFGSTIRFVDGRKTKKKVMIVSK